MKEQISINNLNYDVYNKIQKTSKMEFVKQVEDQLIVAAQEFYKQEYNLDMTHVDTFVLLNKIHIVLKWKEDNELLLSYVVTTDFEDMNNLFLSKFDMNEKGIIAAYIMSKIYSNEMFKFKEFIGKNFNNPVIDTFPIHMNKNLYYKNGLYFSVIQKDFDILIDYFKKNKSVEFLSDQFYKIFSRLENPIIVGVDVYVDNNQLNENQLKKVKEYVKTLFPEKQFNECVTLSSKHINANFLVPVDMIKG